MADPGLASRLGSITVPALAVWGEADRIASPEYGKEYTAAIPGAAFRLMRGAGHLPQLETPEATLEVLAEFGGWPARPAGRGA
jgi:pimeloyl-ACP methyl ester carboxylesterase